MKNILPVIQACDEYKTPEYWLLMLLKKIIYQWINLQQQVQIMLQHTYSLY